jgi:superfamily II DNA or RNA helicase
MPTQFSDFYQSLNSDPVKRGKQFEIFVKEFLKTDPEWSTQVAQVWLWDEWPERWGRDCGIDLVFRHKNGEYWAVQAKCYSPDYAITKHDVDKFLSESSRPIIKHRLLIATTDRIGANAKSVCDAPTEKPVRRFLLSDFELAKVDYSTDFASLTQVKRKARPTPRDHQNEARAAVVEGLQTADRGQLIMACGTGKTYVTLWIKEDLNAQRTLVLVPSLGLLSQLLHEWTFAATTQLDVLCVCSDQSVAKGNDETIHSVADFAFPVTSDAEEVKQFLSGDGSKVVFSTYQSSAVIAAAQADLRIPSFDLIVADEAHRCTGTEDSEFTIVLDNTRIRGAKRLFATATPRTYSSNVKKTAEERGVEVIGMDNATLFGEVLYALPFGQAIARNLLTDYRVVIIGVDDPTIAQWITSRELVTTGTGIEADSQSLAAQIGMIKAIKDYDLKRVISFHSRVSRAEAFSRDVQKTAAWIDGEHRPVGALRTDFVSGAMSAHKRRVKIDQLKALSLDERGVLSNARCLSEGVDVPSLDGVAFIDPRSSQVDIIQAVGRAIRLSADKKVGTIVLPVFIAAGKDAEETIENSCFKPIWDVLNALKAHDDVLACELDQIRIGLGKLQGRGVSAADLQKITIDLPATVDQTFGSALRTHLVERVTDSWDERFGQLISFKEINGDCNVPFEWTDNPTLAIWCSTQRYAYKENRISPRKKERLEQIGFVWNRLDEAWEKMLVELADYQQLYGNCNVPKKWKHNPRLATWCVHQRTDFQRGKLSGDRIKRMEALNFQWTPNEIAWEEMAVALMDYKAAQGTCDVPREWSDNPKLGKWCAHQRQAKQKGKLSASRLHRLGEMGFNWNTLDATWETMFDQLCIYKKNHGNCNVPNAGKDDPKLANWCASQRGCYKNGKLAAERIHRLEQLGFVWDMLSDNWETMFAALLVWRQIHGSSIVSDRKSQLAVWCQRQRSTYKNNTMSPERIKRLDDIGFVWDPIDSGWEAMYAALIAYKQRFGDCNVPASWEGKLKLGQWCSVQRRTKKKNSISTERIQRLERIGFVWELLEVAWEEMFSALSAYRQIHGHCNVPTNSKDDPKLGQWCSNQRVNYKDGNLAIERVQRLTLLGFVWDPLALAWEEMLSALADYKKIYGDCNVPVKWAGNPKLGMWCGTQRRDHKSKKLSPEREARLRHIGFRLISTPSTESINTTT